MFQLFHRPAPSLLAQATHQRVEAHRGLEEAEARWLEVSEQLGLLAA